MKIVGHHMTKETTVHNHEIARQIAMERNREIERILRHRPEDRNEPSRIRRNFGHGLIRIGEAIAAEHRLRQLA